MILCGLIANELESSLDEKSYIGMYGEDIVVFVVVVVVATAAVAVAIVGIVFANDLD